MYARLVASAERAISSSRAADGQPPSGSSRCCDREIPAHDLLDRLGAEALALLAELLGERVRDEVLLRVEVGVERAVGQPRVRHERGDPRPVDAVALEPTAGRLDDPPPRRLLVVFSVPSHARLHEPEVRPAFLL